MTTYMPTNIIGHPVPIALGILIILLAGLGLGVINGSAVSRIGMPALIVTLAMWQISTGAAFSVSQGVSVGFQPESLAFFGKGTIAGVPVPVYIFVAVAVIVYFVLNYTTFGRSVYAVGGNPVSAWLSGINVKNILFAVYAISGFLAGLAAVIMSARAMGSSMSSLSGLEMDTIAAVVVGGVSLFGGRGTLVGVVIGVIIIGIVNNGMSIIGAGPALIALVKGSIIIGAVAVDYIRRRG